MVLNKDLRRVLDVGIALTGETDYYRLLEKILEESMGIAGSDSGILYTKEPDGLAFTFMRNNTLRIYLGGRSGIDQPKILMSEENVCAFSVLRREMVNIPDIYRSGFDFTATKKYDRAMGYHTKSMLVIPLENHAQECLGVIQLINALDDQGRIVSFDPQLEYIIHSLASQTAITIDNMNHFGEMKELLNSMVAAFTTAIDERTPYNANHTKNVAKYTGELIDFINQEYSSGNTELCFDRKMKEQLVMAAMLHDIGKLVTPIEIMNKATRLGSNLSAIVNRFELIRVKLKVDCLEGTIQKAEWERLNQYLEDMLNFVKEVNDASFFSEEMEAQVKELGQQVYVGADGEKIPYITPEEQECLSIKKGTLTAKERVVMEEHANITIKLLEQIHFGKEYRDVPFLAGVHHEFLDGSGYPEHLTGEEIPCNARILTVLDIYDSLISTDRPYKKPMSKECAILILEEMTEAGKLDGMFVEELKRLVRMKQRKGK